MNKAGHSVKVYERADQIGGLLRYGIPDFKLDKNIVKRRVDLMEKEGIIFETNVQIGSEIKLSKLLSDFDAILIATGSTTPRVIQSKEGCCRHLPRNGILSQQNKRVANISLYIIIKANLTLIQIF